MKYFSLLILVYALIACKTAQVKNPYESSYISMEKTACYGWCPVYKITISGTGKVLYEGRKNVERKGKFEKQLSAEVTRKLFMTFDSSAFASFKSEYTEPITDLPTTFLTFSHRENTKTIKDYYNAPPELKKLEKMVEEIANSDGWTEVGN